MTAMAQDDPVTVIDTEAMTAARDGNRPVLSFGSPAKHAIGPRARAFVFSDPRSRALIPLIEKTAPSDASILVVGDTGTGKELVARYVHSLSNRANKPFVAVNCGAFSESLVEGELFGYEKGAFTGAHAARAGWFEAANGGTLFLDEVGDLPASLQVKLLRVLQEREVIRIGSRTPISLDIRIISATNVDLDRAVSSGTFRQDLFYRLNVITIPLLPLRERRADILPLARHFLEVYGARIQARRLEISPRAEEVLFTHSWPGNIRELENAIHRAVLTCHDGLIQPTDLGLDGSTGQEATGSGDSSGLVDEQQSLDEFLRPFIARLLEQGHDRLLDRMIETTVAEAFHQSDSNQIRTAAALGITRNVVRTYLRNLGLI